MDRAQFKEKKSGEKKAKIAISELFNDIVARFKLPEFTPHFMTTFYSFFSC